MTSEAIQDAAPSPQTPAPKTKAKRGRFRGGGQSIIAQGEPIVWMNGAGLVICTAMVVGLLLLVLYQGITTFWPRPLIQVRTIDDKVHAGEVTRNELYSLTYGNLQTMSSVQQDAAGALLHPNFHEKLSRLFDSDRFRSEVAALAEPAREAILTIVSLTPHVRDAAARDRHQLLSVIDSELAEREEAMTESLEKELQEVLAADETGKQLFERWNELETREASWLAQTDLVAMEDAFRSEAQIGHDAWSSRILALLSRDISVPMRRRLIRTGNFELTNEHFNYVNDFELAEDGESHPDWMVVFERLSWGRFYGEPSAMLVDEEQVATEPGAIWEEFLEVHPTVRARWRERRELEIHDTGRVNRLLEEARLTLREVELKHGKNSRQWSAANAEFQGVKKELDAEFADIRKKIQELDKENDRFQLVVATAQGQEKKMPVSEIVRAYPANQLALGEKTSVYFSRWGEFLVDDPREANSEGGVFPAIWGTVTMTLLMSVAVVPFGVLASLYLREYAKAGLLVSVVRIAVNNLAGVPSIVFGVFGLGFFCYIIGASVDELFFEAKLPSPTFGTGGLMWAAFTLALLTLPVVIVATEEALAAVPRSMREGSLACGATKWQTIRRIVLPRAMPGIMTGTILAMARGAGEVAPLMLVGAVKLAPELPVDGVFPFVHLQRSFMHLGFHIYDLGFQSQNSEAAKPMVFTTTLLLISLIAFMNVLAIWLRARLRKKFEFDQF
jgi:phosphate transport system permease protein